jgi:hypothetical protein
LLAERYIAHPTCEFDYAALNFGVIMKLSNRKNANNQEHT